ncbi:MAG TPA: hypothetical protein VNT75_21770 [Symbiobacteriaceae bacterium]|nr:hypothetical protein [Symbiobacteriaceae bacterium]
MTTSNHSTIRFIGFSIPTTPGDLVSIGDPNGPGAVAGMYLGNDDLLTDIEARIAVLKNAVDAAKAQLPAGEDPTQVTNLFVAPEFFFHGTQGPYVYESIDEDPVSVILAKLTATFNATDYPNWTFVCGSAVTAQIDNINNLYASNSVTVRNAVVESLSKQWLEAFGPLNGVIFDMLVNFIKNCHSYPVIEVRNRALIVSNILLDAPGKELNTNTMTTEKYYVSNEDFLLYETSGNPRVVTEQMTAYPFIDLTSGDLKQSAYDKYAIFRQNYGAGNFPTYMDFGVEICLDHSDVRLRRNIDNEPFPLPTDAVHVQIIPSCGMQIQPASVAADANGFVFNCDGQYSLDTTSAQTQQGNMNGVQSIYTNYAVSGNSNYQAHTQLARVQVPAHGGDPNRHTSANATFQTLDPTDTAVVPVPATPDLDQYFAGGSGAVHIYGLKTPYILYPVNTEAAAPKLALAGERP